MNKTVVITSIFEPTEAVRAFALLQGYETIVIGDRKTPKDWQCSGVSFISIEDQKLLPFHLASKLPVDHYCRKMLGYLQAIANDAEVIVDTDDDNIPKSNWSYPEISGKFLTIPRDQGFVNIYQLFTDQKIWPRGLPLELITKSFQLKESLSPLTCKVGIWQGLADEDPDVDAIYRLSLDEPCLFSSHEPVVLQRGTLCPFNSQNTVIRKELFPLLYLPAFVSFRFTDILRGLVAQPIMWLYDYHLGFTEATVIQRRNPHDYMEDFMSEIPMYRHCKDVADLVLSAISSGQSIEDNLSCAYRSLFNHNIVCEQELATLEYWLNDIQSVA